MARGGKRRDRRKEQFWRRLLRLQRSSGLTIRDFCAEHDVSEPSFFAWRRTIAERNRQRRRRARPKTVGGKGEADTNSNAGAGNGITGGDAPAKARAQLAKKVDHPLFVPLRVVSTLPRFSGEQGSPSMAFEIVLTSGHIVRVPANFEASNLRQLFAVLENMDRRETAEERRC
jgi:Transposase